MGRSILAIIVGFLTIIVSIMISITIIILLMVGNFDQMEQWQPTTTYLAVNIATGAFFGMLGGYVTASIANHSRMQHVFVLAAIILVMGLITVLFASDPRQPEWYNLVNLVMGPLAVLAGGALRARKVELEMSV